MNKFYKIFNENYISKAVSNARVNLIGEHTDYTGGYVLPILLDKKTEIFISLNKDNHNVFSDYFNEMVSFNDLTKSRNNHCVDYIKGSLSIIKSNYDLPKHFFNILISSNIPIIRGISSSAAICVSVLKAINNYYDLKIDNKSVEFMAATKLHELGACDNCHFYGTTFPKQEASTWAANLAMTKERLNPDWVKEWLRDPQTIMPGTKMPAPYLPDKDILAMDGAENDWGQELVKLDGDTTAMLNGLRDYMWNIKGKTNIDAIIKDYFDENGYDFESSDDDFDDDDDWGDDDDW